MISFCHILSAPISWISIKLVSEYLLLPFCSCMYESYSYTLSIFPHKRTLHLLLKKWLSKEELNTILQTYLQWYHLLVPYNFYSLDLRDISPVLTNKVTAGIKHVFCRDNKFSSTTTDYWILRLWRKRRISCELRFCTWKYRGKGTAENL